MQTFIDGVRMLDILTGFVLMFLLAKVCVVIMRPDSMLGDHNRHGRFLLVVALILLDVSVIGTEWNRLGADVGYWRLPVNTLGIIICLIGTYYTFYVPDRKQGGS